MMRRGLVALGLFVALGLVAVGLGYAEDAPKPDAPKTAPAVTPPAAPTTPAPEAAKVAEPAPAATPAAPASPLDPEGTKTGNIGDTGLLLSEPAALSADDAKDPAKAKAYAEAKKAYDENKAAADKEPLAVKLADVVGHNKIAINIVWTLITGFLVMFMQFGFAAVETGLCRAKNAGHTITMNMMIYPLGMIGFYLCGFAFMFGGVGNVAALGGGAGTAALDQMYTVHMFGADFGLLGLKGFCLGPSVYDVSIFTLFLFQMVFMDTTATIPTGAMAERWGWWPFVAYGLAVGTIIYPIYGCWVWGGGWLAMLGKNFGLGHGHMDFAGSSVVHMTGGVLALVGAWFIGPRIGKYNKDGTANVMPAHNIPMAVLGCFVLAFGWFGFNPGSTLAGTDMRIAIVAVNTMLAGTTGCLMAMAWITFRTGKPDPSMMVNGLLAGLVAITAPSGFVDATGACIIGLVAGFIVIEAVFFFDRILKIDDPVGAISVHGINGAWGCLSIGLFADGKYGAGWNGVDGYAKGLFYGGGMSQFWAELIGVLTNFIFVGIMGFVVFFVIDKIVGTRVSSATELEGLDIPEMGAPGYCGVALDKSSETPISV